jgi:hypothetical protein
MLSGCANDFFDIQESMQVPKLSEKNRNLVGVSKSYLGSDFNFSYHFVNNRCCGVTEHEFSDGKVFKIMFCQTEIEPEKIHTLLLNQNENENWKVFGEIVSKVEEIDKIYLKDINDDGVDEILLCKNDGNPITEVYQLCENDIVKIQTLKENI